MIKCKQIYYKIGVIILPETNNSSLKIDGWKTIVSYWDAISLGIQSPKLRMVMEPKYYAFRRWLYTPIILWRSVSQDP